MYASCNLEVITSVKILWKAKTSKVYVIILILVVYGRFWAVNL